MFWGISLLFFLWKSCLLMPLGHVWLFCIAFVLSRPSDVFAVKVARDADVFIQIPVEHTEARAEKVLAKSWVYSMLGDPWFLFDYKSRFGSDPVWILVCFNAYASSILGSRQIERHDRPVIIELPWLRQSKYVVRSPWWSVDNFPPNNGSCDSAVLLSSKLQFVMELAEQTRWEACALNGRIFISYNWYMDGGEGGHVVCEHRRVPSTCWLHS